MAIATDVLYFYFILSEEFDSKHFPSQIDLTFIISHYLIELTLNFQAVKSS